MIHTFNIGNVKRVEIHKLNAVRLELDCTVQGGGLGLRVGPPSARFTCKRPASHGLRNTNYSNKLHIRLTSIITC